jgi:cysteine desulfurase
MNGKRYYLDYAATTPLDERVLAAMAPYFSEIFGNPSSVHTWGQQAEYALEQSREQVSRVLNARSEEIVFTSCGSESDNLAIRGAAFFQRKTCGANHILISPVEHPAVSQTARQLANEFGFTLELLSVDEFGRVDPGEVEASIRPNTALVSVVYANNEIGTINPISEIGAICHKKGVPFHSDAVQAAAHLPLNVIRDQVDLLAIGAHKFYGPKGVGVLYVRRDIDILPSQTGGKQEYGLRSGTQNIPYIVGLAEALRLTQEEREARVKTLIPLRDRLIEGVLSNVPRARLTGHPSQRLPNHASFVFEGVEGNSLLMMLDIAGFGCSSGSACKVGAPKPSDVLMAVGLSRSWASGSLRVTMGKDTTIETVDAFLEVLPRLVTQARSIS